jgi:hypothetical protein
MFGGKHPSNISSSEYEKIRIQLGYKSYSNADKKFLCRSKVDIHIILTAIVTQSMSFVFRLLLLWSTYSEFSHFRLLRPFTSSLGPNSKLIFLSPTSIIIAAAIRYTSSGQ